MKFLYLLALALAACAGPIPLERKPEPVDRASITAALRAHESELAACYESAHDPALAGRLTLQWDIGERGKVSQVRVVQPLHPAVDDCVATALENWTFPVNAGGDRVRRVLYPFSFRSQ